MARRRTIPKIVLGGAALLIVGVLAFGTLGQTAKWIGHTDLEVRFSVVDAESALPIPNATIHVHTERGGWLDDESLREFTVVTDDTGHWSQLCKDTTCAGSHGVFEDTFFVYLPSWWYRAAADGYADSKPEFLDARTHAARVERLNPGARLSIPIHLRQAAAGK